MPNAGTRVYSEAYRSFPPASSVLLAIGLFIVSSDSDKHSRQTGEFEATNLVQALAVNFQQGIVAAQAGEGSIGGISGKSAS